jgi:hypothetical protein
MCNPVSLQVADANLRASANKNNSRDHVASNLATNHFALNQISLDHFHNSLSEVYNLVTLTQLR